MFPVDPSKRTLSKNEEVKDLIVALKVLRKAADQNHAGACYLFGSTFGYCYRFPERLNCTFQVQSTLVKAFKGALSKHEFDHSLFNRAERLQNGNLLISSFCHDIAMKYLCKAARLGNQDATAEIQAIDSYRKQLQDRAIDQKVQELMQQSSQRGSNSAVMIAYQTI